jgi:uncharacterized protein (TIGR02271 family)
MMESNRCTIVGMFDDRAEALAAREELLALGLGANDVNVSDEPTTGRTTTAKRGFWSKVKEFFGTEDAAIYSEASRRGGTLLKADCESETQADLAADILRRHHAVDIDERAKEWRASGWTAPTTMATEGRLEEQSIPVTEEKLKVGKRAEQRGGVRVYSHVTETPVEQDVLLREEKVRVERRPADRPATESDFQERTIEATEMREEAVVAKEARVVEEVVLSKEVDEHTETIRDTIRKIDIDVQDLEVEFRRDFDQTYASTGATYEQYRPAYDYGRELATSGTASDWSLIESDAQKRYEQQYPGRWSTHRDAIRRGYERTLARR